jgi:predicted TIM-barrel fold metal-dependent hydrolase
MIIDSHVHIGNTEKIDRFFTFNNYLTLMEDQQITYSVVMPNVSSTVKTSDLNSDFLYNFEHLSDVDKKRLIPFLLIDPNDKTTILQLRRCICTELIKGVKFHPSICQMKVNDPDFEIFIDYTSEFKIPMLIHCGRHHISHISYIIDVAKKYPKGIFIAAHMGGNASDLIEETLDLLYKEKLENLYLDTSANKLPYLVEKAVKLLGSEKLLFGSDEPYADVRVSKYCIDISNISYKQKEDILYENSKNLFNLN